MSETFKVKELPGRRFELKDGSGCKGCIFDDATNAPMTKRQRVYGCIAAPCDVGSQAKEVGFDPANP